MGIIYIHWFQSLNICIKLMITDSHNEIGGGGRKFFCFVLLLAVIIVGKFSFNLVV